MIRLDECMRISEQSVYSSSTPHYLFQPSTDACELVISALSRRLQWKRAIELLDFMNQTDIPKTVVTYNTVISACARSREVGMAKNLLSRMRKDGIRPDVASFNSVIGACANTARWKEALTVLDQCYREPGVTPNIYTYTNAMRYVLLYRYKQQRREFSQFILVSVPGSCSLSVLAKKSPKSVC
jgi:pentatricopeptide repeat domain-containing protein 1